jgi:hypothetical protein
VARLEQAIEVGLHVGHALKLQLELAPVRPRNLLDFGEAALDILDPPRSLAPIGDPRTTAASVVSPLILIFSHRLPFRASLSVHLVPVHADWRKHRRCRSPFTVKHGPHA